ncbi:hypothetical protein DFP73DRAFT_583226 [Morchella snyderi]|nr:hypothetical protein DFP73DRAFT_583226 [Morchella snyderi]
MPRCDASRHYRSLECLFSSGQLTELHLRSAEMFLLTSEILPGDLTIDDIIIVSFQDHHPECPCPGRSYDFTQTLSEPDGAIAGACVVRCGGMLKFHLRNEFLEHQHHHSATPVSTKENLITPPKAPAPPETPQSKHSLAGEAAFPFLAGPYLHRGASAVGTICGEDYMQLNAQLEFAIDGGHSPHQHGTLLWLPRRCSACHVLFAARSAPANACFPGSEAVGQLLYGKDGLVYHDSIAERNGARKG